jgi:hypothetical protein
VLHTANGQTHSLEAFVGNVSGDAQPEIVVQEEQGWNFKVLAADGRLLSELAAPLTVHGLWDADGDGRDEIICERELADAKALKQAGGQIVKGDPDQLVFPHDDPQHPAYHSLDFHWWGETAVTLQGRHLLHLPFRPVGWGHHVWTQVITADADGDGDREWWALDSQGNLVVVNQGGKVLLNTDYTGCDSIAGDSLVTADLDGDGRAEGCCLAPSGTLSIFGLAPQWQSTARPEPGRLQRSYRGLPAELQLSQAVDVDGDGDLDLVCQERGWIELPAGSFHEQAHDPRLKNAGPATSYASALIDLDGDGQLDHVAAAGQLNWFEAYNPRSGKVLRGEAHNISATQPLQTISLDGKSHLLLAVDVQEHREYLRELLLYP